MAYRREFSRKLRAQIVERATKNGVIVCEGCGLVLAGKLYEVDHLIPEALRPEADKAKPLTIADGQLLGKECCHRSADGKTAKDVAQIAKAKRQADKHSRAICPKHSIKSAGFPRAEKVRVKAELPPLPKRSLYRSHSDAQ